MSWTDLAKQLSAEAEEKVKSAETLMGLALQAYEQKPCRANEIAIKAAARMLKESRAMREEWLL